jgi:surface antigen
MTSESVLSVLFLLGVGLAAAPADFVAAGNLSFLRDAPIAYFDEKDTALFKSTTFAVLEQARDGETRRWANDDTGNSGEVKVLRTLPDANAKCRELQISNHAGGRSSTQHGTFCYDVSKARWTVRPSK